MTRSTFFCQKKVLFFAKKKYFFLQIKVLFFAKKKYFFLQKKVLLCSDIITFHAVQCITRGAPKPPPRLSGPGLDVLEQQGQQDAVINKDNVIITNRSGRWWPWSGRYGHGREVMDIVEEVMDIVGEVMNITRWWTWSNFFSCPV